MCSGRGTRPASAPFRVVASGYQHAKWQKRRSSKSDSTSAQPGDQESPQRCLQLAKSSTCPSNPLPTNPSTPPALFSTPPNRTEFLPMIRDATNGDHPVVRSILWRSRRPRHVNLLVDRSVTFARPVVVGETRKSPARSSPKELEVSHAVQRIPRTGVLSRP